MKVLYQSIWHRVIVIVMAVIFSAAMMIPVSADEMQINGNLYYGTSSQYNQITLNNSYNIDGSYYKLGFLLYFADGFLDDYTYIINATIKTKNYGRNYTDSLYSAEIVKTKPTFVNNPGNMYDSVTYSYSFNQNGNDVTNNYIITFNSNNIEDLSSNFFSFFTEKYNDQFYINATEFSGYIVYDPNESALDQINNKLDIILDNQVQTNQNLTTIIQNQITINDNIIQIFNYGNTYNQIDQTLINNLGTAEDHLRNAEDAIQNKSGSLQQSVSSQWNEATTKTRGFVSTVAPATTALTTTITQIVNAMPEEAQLLLTVIPMLLFIGWLIGRIGGG